jgi:nuclear pore complex protein Nup160
VNLLESERQTLLRVFSLDQESVEVYVLAFVPSHSPAYGGIFHLLKSVGDNLVYLGSLESSKNSVHLHLQDFIFLPSQQSNTPFTQPSVLYTLWDKQGASVVERISFDSLDLSRFVPQADVWLTSTYSEEVELTPTYLDELLLAPGSMADKFLSAITCPGMFSSLTLRTAITQYTEAYLSLPGPPAPQLQTTYATVTEHIAGVVGCTVNLLRDNRTGALQYDNYWNALKRDWEGFVARCREIERSARWPLALGVDANGSIIVVERERTGLLTTTDLPLRLHRALLEGLPVEQFPLLDIAWTLKTKLGTQLVLDLERRLIDLVHQEIAFPFADVVQDQARHLNFAAELDEGLESYTHGRLTSIEDMDAATHVILDIIAGVDVPVKTEEDEAAALLLTSVPTWKRALTANYVSATIHVRYDMCISLLTLLFLLASDLQRWDPGLLTEIFAVFRCVALMKFVSRQPAGEIAPRAASSAVPSADDLVAHMRNMNVSRNERFSPSYSLTYRLLDNLRDMPTLHSNAHLFLESTGLLQSSSPAEVTKFEIMFAERLRLLGYGNIVEDYLSWLPRTPGVIYVCARLRLDQGRADDAAVLFERVAAVFGKT